MADVVVECEVCTRRAQAPGPADETRCPLWIKKLDKDGKVAVNRAVVPHTHRPDSPPIVFNVVSTIGSTVTICCPGCGGRAAVENTPDGPVESKAVAAKGLSQQDLRPKGAPREIEVQRDDVKVPDATTAEGEFRELESG